LLLRTLVVDEKRGKERLLLIRAPLQCASWAWPT
jgi:hypothetical protein